MRTFDTLCCTIVLVINIVMVQYAEIGNWKDISVYLFYSEDISLEGLQQELEECKNDEVSYSSIPYITCIASSFFFFNFWEVKSVLKWQQGGAALHRTIHQKYLLSSLICKKWLVICHIHSPFLSISYFCIKNLFHAYFVILNGGLF